MNRVRSRRMSNDDFRRPNLLFIMTDQQRFDTLSLAGNTILQTPNMDRIGRDGAYFKLALSHCPVCGPDRASMLTGCGIERTKVRTNYHLTWAPGTDVMDAGYYCEYQGKWHSPIHKTTPYQGFRYEPQSDNGYHCEHLTMFEQWVDDRVPDRELKQGEQRDDTYKRPYITDPIDKRYGVEPDGPLVDQEGNPLPDIQPNRHGGFQFDAKHSFSAFQGTQTIAALHRAKESGKPFAVTASFNYPHAPLVVSPPYYRMYDPDEMPIPPSIGDDHSNSPYGNANQRSTCPEYSDPELIKYMISNYYGLVKEIDDWVGRILDTLEEIGEADNTFVIFTSDHGEMLGDHGLREKNIFYEGSVHVPLTMRFPGRIKPGTVVAEPVSHLDLFSTILDYLGLDIPDSDGESLRPLIDGTDEYDGERFAVAEWNYDDAGNWLHGPNFCVRTKKWKFMYCREPKPGIIDCLFDLANDPHEMNNLIGLNPDHEKQREQAETMKSLLVRYLEERNHPSLETVRAKPTLFSELPN